MKYQLFIGMAFVFLTGCDKTRETYATDKNKKIGIHGIYMDLFYVGDGFQEKELYLGCESNLKEKIKQVDTISNFAPLRMEVPCKILSSIDDSISAADSILKYTGKWPEVWYYVRYRKVDTGIVVTRKMFPFKDGKAHIWWMMDFILKHSPESFKSARLGPYPLPPRNAPPDSAWLDTVKQGLF